MFVNREIDNILDKFIMKIYFVYGWSVKKKRKEVNTGRERRQMC